jgi:hypothetical protein
VIAPDDSGTPTRVRSASLPLMSRF